jgi:hypothetical protein
VAAHRQPPQAQSAVLHPYVDTGRGRRSEAEPVTVDADDSTVDLGDEAAGSGAGGRQVAGEGKAAAPDVWAVSGSPSGKAVSTTEAMARTYANFRCAGSATST